jgi:DNA-binding MarR family transcriptional regulator
VALATSDSRTAAGAAKASPAGREAWQAIQRLSGEMKKRYLALAAEFELSPPQFWTLRALEQPRTMSEVAATLLCDNSNVTGIIDRLEERGLVERRQAPGDRRVKLLVLTAAGERMRRAIVEVMDEPPAWISELSREDQRALRDILQRAAG